jgi:predicted TPR repeat methyltransferase
VQNNTTNSLDLYAKVEDLLGVAEVAPALYAHYLLFLNATEFTSLLDVGCGSGNFLLQMQKALDIQEVKGIDLSPLMVGKTREHNIDAECIDLCSLDAKFDVITAVFDMLNYLDKDELQTFLTCVNNTLNEGGYFLCDINTLFGFEEVAVGSFIADDDERFLTVDSEFEEGQYTSEFTLFEKNGAYFKKSKEIIKQYFHTVDEIVKYSALELVISDDVNLYGLDEQDKVFVVLKKV